MSSMCPVCSEIFRDGRIATTHVAFCRILSGYRGGTYVLRRKDPEESHLFGDVLIHIDRDAKVHIDAPEKVRRHRFEKVGVSGGFCIYPDGTGMGNQPVFYIPDLFSALDGTNPRYIAEKATPEDIELAKGRLCMRFDKAVTR